MKYLIIATCLGTFNIQHLTEGKDAFWLEVTIGIPFACVPEIKIRDEKSNDLLGYWRGAGSANSIFNSNETLTLKIPKCK